MAQYIYKNTHFFPAMDLKRIIKMSLKVLYAGWGPTACYSMTFAGLYISSSPRAVATGSHHEKPILPKIIRQKSFKTITIEFKHTSYPQEIIFLFWSAKKERIQEKNVPSLQELA